MQRGTDVSLAHQLAEQFVSGFLSFDKDQGSEIFLVLVLLSHLSQDFQQSQELLIGVSDLDLLRDLLGHDRSASNGDF